MSKIQEALSRLQREPREIAKRPGRSESTPSFVRTKAEVSGEKHEVDIDKLMAAGLLVNMDTNGPIVDELRRIKRPVLDNVVEAAKAGEQRANAIMIASAHPGSGKTFCAINLARSMSIERDINVVLVDGDVAKPHISQEFGLRERPGLIDVLLDRSISVADALVRTNLNDIQVLPVGTQHRDATELLASDRMNEVIDELAFRYDDRVIVIDSPPLLDTSEAQVLARRVGQVVLVVEYGETTRQALTDAVSTLNPDMPVNIILNRRPLGAKSKQEGGRYGYYGYK